VGRFEEANQCPAGLAGQVRPRRSEVTRRLSASPAESEAPGTEINRPIVLPKLNGKSVDKLAFIECVYRLKRCTYTIRYTFFYLYGITLCDIMNLSTYKRYIINLIVYLGAAS
jgi:hypothetical protein